MPRKEVRWFIYPLKASTNGTIAARLDAGESMTEILCPDGKKRPVWECDREFVDRMRSDAHSEGYKFWVYKVEGFGRAMRDIEVSKVKKKAKALRAKILKTKRRPAATASK